MSAQIKSKERVSVHGEVFTNAREVKHMLDLVQQEASSIVSTFLEPACGNGNFLYAILSRKLSTVQRLYGHRHLDYTLNAIRAVSSIYGIDIQRDNVEEAKSRLFNQVFTSYINNFQAEPPEALQRATRAILGRNIQCGNTLTFQSAEGKPLMISEWEIDEHFCITRKDYEYRAMVKTGCAAEPVRVYSKVNIIWIDKV